MKTSARNRFAGIVKSIANGSVYSQVVLELPGGQEIVATVTCESVAELGLSVGSAAIALVKASSIIIATDLERIRLSARNQLKGTIAHIERGAVHSVVTLDLGGGYCASAGVTMQSTEQLDLRPGQHATAVFKAGNVILGVLV